MIQVPVYARRTSCFSHFSCLYAPTFGLIPLINYRRQLCDLCVVKWRDGGTRAFASKNRHNTPKNASTSPSKPQGCSASYVMH